MNAPRAALLLLLAGCTVPGPLGPGDGPQGGGARDGGGGEGGAAPLYASFTIAGCATLRQDDSGPSCSGPAPLRLRLVPITTGAEQFRWQVAEEPEGTGGDGGLGDGGAGQADGGAGTTDGGAGTTDGGAGTADGAGPNDGGAGADGGAGMTDGAGPNDGGAGADGGRDGGAGMADGGDPDAGASDGGPLLDDALGRERSPALVLPRPGRYRVTLAVRGRGGTASAAGLVEVTAAALGARCERDEQCGAGLFCLCGGGDCPGGLGAGLCTRACDAAPCPAGSVCADLSLGAMRGDGGAPSWRRPLCLPGCRADGDCRADLLCRELPARGGDGGLLRFERACFAAVPAAIGEACADPGGGPDASVCASGLCEPLGARNLCSAACASGADCGSAAACAQWNGGAGAPAGPRCLPRCDAMRPCADPLLACQPAGGAGALGFRLPGEPAGQTVCAPRRCSGPADCKLGRCQALGGASFCVR